MQKNSPKFEYYVLNYDANKRKVVYYNIFNNIRVYEAVLAEVKKYVRAPAKYKPRFTKLPEGFIGFDAFCYELEKIIMWQEWSRCEYEIMVGDLFESDASKLEKWDAYGMAKPNIKMIAREVIYQYRQFLKNK